MGKIEEQYVQQEEQRENHGDCARCSVVLRAFSFKCLFILFLSLSAFLSGIFWILPKHTVQLSFDEKDEIKNSGNDFILPFPLLFFSISCNDFMFSLFFFVFELFQLLIVCFNFFFRDFDVLDWI